MNDSVNYAKIQRIQDDLEALTIGQFGTGFVTDAMLYESGIKSTVANHTSQLAEKTTYINIKKFGAKGDGVTNDSQAFKDAFTSGVDGLFIPEGIYIINITAGTNHDSRDFASGCNVYNVKGIKGKSIIKLGSGNGNEVLYTGYQALFNYGGADVDVSWEDIVFDFNYANNRPQQYTGQYENTVVNSQQMAINCYKIRDLRIRNCVFIDQSGTNCIIYRGNASNSRNANVIIEKNSFLDMGKPSQYNNSGTMVDAYHDCSTLSIHLDTTLSNKTLTAYIKDNIFVGSGHNAYDVCECGANVSYFENNTVENYCIGFMPLASTPNVESHCKNNTFTNVIIGLNIWNGIVDVSYAETELAFKLLDIRNNTIIVNPIYHMYTPTFLNHTITDGVVTNFTFSAMQWGGVPSKSIGRLIATDNYIEYYKDAVVTGYPSSIGNYTCNGINFYLQFSGSVLSGFTQTPYITDIDISRNKFINVWRQPILMITYPKIIRIKVDNNTFYNCNFDTIYNNPAAPLIDFRLYGNGSGNYISNSNLNAYNELTSYTNNVFKGTSEYATATKFGVYQNTYSVPNSVFLFKNNVFDKAPQVYVSQTVTSGTLSAIKSDGKGQATILASATSVTVTHNLGFTPTNVICTAQGDVGNVWVNGITSTQFVINCKTAPASNTVVSWKAES